MDDMIGAVMRHCRNYFEGTPVEGIMQIDDSGYLHAWSDVQPCLFVAIRGSSMHDGVWRIDGGYINVDGATPDLPGETFTGTVWPLYPTQAFIGLCKEAAEFESKRPLSPLQSESFGGYSYTVASGQSGALAWQEAYAGKLTPYRRMFTEVGV